MRIIGQIDIRINMKSLLLTAYLIPNHSGLKETIETGDDMPEWGKYICIGVIIVMIVVANILSRK
jgi:hypothetical protein